MEGVQTGTARISHVVQARTHQATVALSGLLPLVVNNKEHGLIHRLSEGSRNAARDQRRTLRGWRAGSVAANVRFCNTSVWPPLGVSTIRLCSKCFPTADVLEERNALSDDPIADTD